MRTLSLLLLLMLVAVDPGCKRTDPAADTYNDDRGDNRVPAVDRIDIRAAEEAIKHARDALGISTLGDKNVTARLEVLTSEAIPFLGEALHGKKTWVVEFNDVRLATGKPGVDNKYIRNLRVVLAPDSGQILTVTSSWPENVPAMAPVPPAAEIAKQLEASSQKYVGLPNEAPQTSLAEALNGRETMYWSSEVKQVVAYYVSATSLQYSNRPVWVIQLRGFSPYEPIGGDGASVPVSARDHFTAIVDAKTGQGLGGSSVPQPVEDK